MEPIRFTDEEIKELQQMVDKTNPIKFSLGNFIDFKQPLDKSPNDEKRDCSDISNWEQQNISRGGCFCQQEGVNRSSLRAFQDKTWQKNTNLICRGRLDAECAIV